MGKKIGGILSDFPKGSRRAINVNVEYAGNLTIDWSDGDRIGIIIYAADDIGGVELVKNTVTPTAQTDGSGLAALVLKPSDTSSLADNTRYAYYIVWQLNDTDNNRFLLDKGTFVLQEPIPN